MKKAKKPLKSLFRHQDGTPEGKYLVKRRDGTVPPWPSFVLAGPDPVAEEALLAYCRHVCYLIVCRPDEAARLGFTQEYACDLDRWVEEYQHYRAEHGASDPGMGVHRTDDPATVEDMKKGRSA